jgi:GntP family gluconate:H+ symporter
MNSSYLALIATSGVLVLLLLITRLRVPPFLALLAVSVMVGLIAGMSPAAVLTAMESGLGGTMGHVALIIPLGAIIGKMIEYCGGAADLAQLLSEKVGLQRAALAVTIAAFFVGMPVFFEVSVMMLMPVMYGLAGTTHRNLITYTLPVCTVLLIVHGLLPPHPGAATTSALLGVDMGRVLLWGVPIAALTSVALWWVTLFLTRREYSLSETVVREIRLAAKKPAVNVGSASVPSAARLTIFLVLAPVLLILGGTLLVPVLSPGSIPWSLASLSSSPVISLLTTIGLGTLLLRRRVPLQAGTVQTIVGEAVQTVAMVVLITGAGGAFAKVLITSGVGSALAQSLAKLGLPIIGLGFLLTMLLRALQGPTTVALITAAGILSPAIQGLHLDSNHLALLCIAMGTGGIACSHVNDAGFWIFTRLSGLGIRDGLRTWTVASCAAGLAGYSLTLAAWYAIGRQ